MFNKYFELASNNNTGESLAFVVAEVTFKVAVMTSSVAKFSLFVAKITFVVAEITFNMAVMTSSVPKFSSFVAKVTFVGAQITFEVASVADIKIAYVVAEIIIKDDVITFVVDEITFTVASVADISCL